MTAREVTAAMLSYLRPEQRGIPYGGDTSFNDPIPDAVSAMNAALQKMAIVGPLFAAKQQRSAYFRAPFTVAVSGLTAAGMTATGAFPAWSDGCWVLLPGDAAMNRIVSLSGTTATLQFPYLGTSSSGNATVNIDTVELDPDIITVLEPVRYRGSSNRIEAVSSREELAESYGNGTGAQRTRYFVESAVSGGAIKLRMMLQGFVATDTIFEFQARTSLGILTVADIYTNANGNPDPGTIIPVPANFIDSIFLPLALDVFFSKATVVNYDIAGLRNQDAPALIREQAKTAMELLESMRPQGNKPVHMLPQLQNRDTRNGWLRWNHRRWW
jgi:hypothetical protein